MKCKKNLGSQESVTETGTCNHHAQRVEMAYIKDYNGSAQTTDRDVQPEKQMDIVFTIIE